MNKVVEVKSMMSAVMTGDDKSPLDFYTPLPGGPTRLRIYRDGVLEVFPSYDPKIVAESLWRRTDSDAVAIQFFPDDHGLNPLVSIRRQDGAITYRKGYTPDPVARELWETISRLHPQR